MPGSNVYSPGLFTSPITLTLTYLELIEGTVSEAFIGFLTKYLLSGDKTEILFDKSIYSTMLFSAIGV